MSNSIQKWLNETNPHKRQYALIPNEGVNNGMYGKTHSAETRAKIRALHTGRKHTQASKQKRHNTMIERYGKKAYHPATHTFEGLHCRDWLDKNQDLVERLTYQRGPQIRRTKVIEHMMSLCPTATKNYLSVQICNWYKKKEA
jgi:hypothetical protein